MALTREQILAADDIGSEVVSVPQWGGDVRLRMMNGEQREQLYVAASVLTNEKRIAQFNLLVLVLTLVDDAGQPLFNVEDLSEIQAKNASVLEMLSARALVLNGLAVGAVEAAKKPSETTQQSASGSDLPSPSGEPSQN